MAARESRGTREKSYFVPFVIPGEVVTAQVTREKKKFAEAALMSVETNPHPIAWSRRALTSGAAVGAAYQHIAYERQLAVKTAQVEQTLRRVGRLAEVPMQPTIAAPETYGYRNRIRVHVAGGVTGFFAHDAHALVDIERCAIAAPEVNEALQRPARTPRCAMATTHCAPAAAARFSSRPTRP